jgi:hypothetical protein
VSGFLLEVNVVIALLWPPHEAHERAQRWFAKNASHGWATPRRKLLLRIVSNPALICVCLHNTNYRTLHICRSAPPDFFLPVPLVPAWEHDSGVEQRPCDSGGNGDQVALAVEDLYLRRPGHFRQIHGASAADEGGPLFVGGDAG